MKVKLSKEQIQKIAENPDAKVKVDDPWYIIVIKVLAYICGLILAGYGTAAAATLATTQFI